MRRGRPRPRTDLTDLQLAVLRVLWARGPSTVNDVLDALRPTRALALTTVSTVLVRLERRGAVAHDVEGRQYVYRALLAEGEVRRSMVGSLTERLFGGDAGALVNHLLTEREIDPEELDRLKRAIERRLLQEGADASE
jgi:BlaI family penicillinase repressor